MQYIFENFGYICCFGEVSALDGQNSDVFKNSSLTCADRWYPLLSPIELQPQFRSTRPNTNELIEEGLMKGTLYSYC